MSKKRKAALSKEAQSQVKKRTDEMLDDDMVDVEDADFDESSVLPKAESGRDDKMAMRRRLENYLEERRLQKELGDDFDYK